MDRTKNQLKKTEIILSLSQAESLRDELARRYPGQNHRYLAFCWSEHIRTGRSIDEIVRDEIKKYIYYAFIQRMKSAYYPRLPQEDQEEFTDFIWSRLQNTKY